ncbi:UNVERIFIED_CONTAM: hypothetical protein Sradi_2658700 [Sesamum radiatum]|uniref:Uncharacterized protein n=1 Tax=Sesamum radiatum TaxID=300843 RepID=A0AAW2S6L9_SESRA
MERLGLCENGEGVMGGTHAPTMYRRASCVSWSTGGGVFKSPIVVTPPKAE